METNNKNIVSQFYKQVVGRRDSSLINTFVHKNYIQHSPNGKDGRKGLFEMVEFLKTLPPSADQTSPIKKLIAEGELVVVHLELQFMGKDIRVIELFRLADGMLAEHWDVTEEQKAETSALISLPADVVITEPKNFLAELYSERNIIIHHILTEGNFIAIHAEAKLENLAYALFDIYEFDGSCLANHWAVKQPITDSMPHNNGMF